MSQSILKDKDLFYDAEEIWEDLAHRGYSEDEVETALSHIERTTLAVPGPFWSESMPVYRSFTPEENWKISKSARGLLWQLKSKGVIDHALEDEIIQKAMGMEEQVGCREIKTVAALTIFGYEHKVQPRRVQKILDASRVN